MRGIDAVLRELPGGIYDLSIGFDGDLATEDAFDASIIVSLLTDQRADESEVPESHRRRGWIGDEARDDGHLIGSKLWLFEQTRLTRTTMNAIEDAARDALGWLVEDRLAVAIRTTRLVTTDRGVDLEVTIERTQSRVEQRYFRLWDATGAP